MNREASMNLRIGIIGLGVMGADHAQTIAASVAGAEVAAISDIDGGRLAAAAHQYNAVAHAEAEDLIADPGVNAVIIASHDSTHSALVEACLAHRKPVLCEKPLAPTVEECVRLVLLEEELDLDFPLVSVGFMRRFHQPYQQLRDLLRAGELGRPLVVHETHRNVHAYPGTTAASVVTNSAIHEIDITAWLLDSPIVEAGWLAPVHPEPPPAWEGPQLIHLRAANGAIASVEVSVNARSAYTVSCEIVGDKGSARMAEPPAVVRTTDLQISRALAADWRPVFADAYRRELQEWTDSIRAGRASTLASARDGLDAACVAEAVLAAMDSGSPVPVRRPDTSSLTDHLVPALKGNTNDVP